VDAGQFRLHLRARTGTRIEETARLVDEVENAIRQQLPQGEIAGILDNIGIPNSGISLSYSNNGLIGTGDADILVSLKEGHGSTFEYMRELRLYLNRNFPSTTFYFLPADIVSQTLNFGLPAPLDIQIVGNNTGNNRVIANSLAARIRRIPGAVDIRVQQPADQPKLRFYVDREKALEMGISERDVANSMLMSLSGSGQVQPTFWLNTQVGIQYLINARSPEWVMNSPLEIEDIPISTGGSGIGSGQLLANVAHMVRTNGSPVVRDVKPLITEAEKLLTRGSFIVVRGQAQTMTSSFIGLGIGVCVSIVLVYLLLVVNFQSWSDPFIIISALPGALAGVLWALHVTHTTLSVPGLMGAIMSLGVATANSILVVSFARTALANGKSPMEAALDAGVSRLRPVLMTALAMVIGMVPLSLGLGEGGEQNAPLGRAVIGGLVLATFATLFFVPVVFSLVHRNTEAGAPINSHDSNGEDMVPQPS